MGKGHDAPSRNQGTTLVTNDDNTLIVSSISKAQFVQDDDHAWWVDSGATTHACKDRCWFQTLRPVEDKSTLRMGDDHDVPIEGRGTVVLEFSSSNSITKSNVLHVPRLRKNLVSGPVLNKFGYKQVFESDKCILLNMESLLDSDTLTKVCLC